MCRYIHRSAPRISACGGLGLSHSGGERVDGFGEANEDGSLACIELREGFGKGCVLATAIASFYVVRLLLPRFEYHLLTKIQALPRDTRDAISTCRGSHGWLFGTPPWSIL
jgi:hypothetical protein